MPKLTINNKEIEVPEGITLIQACEMADVEIPRFCYHERLSIAGNCRMCLVEVVGGPPKPVASCAMPAAEGMKILTNSPMVKKAREGVMEFLLANHPLDCPICDQGGECDLQDQAYQYGASGSRFGENKRAVKDKNIGPLIKTTMTRCIHCTRCVRFTTDVAGVPELGAIGRGETMEITSYLEKAMTSELSGNVIDLCPVGALTSKPYAFEARSWELKKTETIDVMDAQGCNIRLDSRGLEVMRILPRLNEEINEEWISDKTRFCYEGLKYQRLTSAYIKKNNKLEKADIDNAIKIIAKKLKTLKSSEIAALSGRLASFDEIFALKELMEKLDSQNFDCRTNSQALGSQTRCDYLFNSEIAKITEADACLLIGVNPRKDAPVLNARLTKKSLDKNFKIAAIGVDADLTYKYENLGDEIEALEALTIGKSEFSEILEKAIKPMLILGEDAISGENGEKVLKLTKKIAKKYNFITENFNGFNFLSKSSGLINGLEAGFDKAKTVDILENISSKKIKLIVLLGVDDDINFTDLKNSFVVYIGSHGDKGAQNADVILPAKAFSEKEAIYINLEGRPQKTTRAVFGPENSRDDVELICDIATAMSINLGFKNREELHKKLMKESEILANIDEIRKAKWQNFDENVTISDKKAKIKAKDYDFYASNAIARAAPILAKCG
ncbi:MAG TPA: NADH-quinone oxidoreductase subunit NuoG [Rickettsiales bacterium]|nr:NADH-quinone oxidoreductase subunit NuoG [Rickettsiales bacterium]